MTANQKRVVQVAFDILRDEHAHQELSDADWQLLLLAAGFNNVCVRPQVAARRVLENAENHRGYFASYAINSRGKSFPCDSTLTASSSSRENFHRFLGLGFSPRS
jgi:hypothetical protein